MGLKIIGAGFGRTGTLSLKNALEQLGFEKCYHMLEVYQNPGHAQRWIDLHHGGDPAWDELFDGYQATVDWPSCNFWREQLEAYPDAKVILSLRDSKGWHRSVMNTIYPSSFEGYAQAKSKAQETGEEIPAMAAQGYKLAVDLIWDGVFDGKAEDEAHACEVFEAHNQEVIRSVPAEQLLVYQPGDGWGPLCEFLDCPIPETDYPKVNSTEDFKKMRAARS